jgi:hypothetical protein
LAGRPAEDPGQGKEKRVTTAPNNLIPEAAPAPDVGRRTIVFDGEDYLMADSDLSLLADQIGARANSLALLPEAKADPDRSARVAADFAALREEHRKRLAIAIGVLRSPLRAAYLHRTVADETISRGALAWSASVPDQIVTIARSGIVRRVSFREPASIEAEIARILAADDSLPEEMIGCTLPAPAVFVFLAILDQIRAVRLYSTLSHSAPPTLFSPAEILQRLSGAEKEDFRWPLNFADKLAPGFAASLTAKDVSESLERLTHAQLIELASQDEKSERYDLADAGNLICDGVLHDVGKVALGVFECRPGGRLGLDVNLWIRGAFQLFFFAISGQEGAVCTVNRTEFEQLLRRSLTSPPAPAVPAEEKPAPEAKAEAAPQQAAAAVWYLSRDGKSEGPYDEAALKKMLEGMPPETLVWSEGSPDWISARDAGMVAAPGTVTCPRCGTKANAGKRFCGECGGPLTH